MTRLSIALAAASLTVVAFTNPTFAQEFSHPTAAPTASFGSSDFNSGPEQKVSTYRKIASEVALLRYRTALRLTAPQERYWPAAAAALPSLSRQTELHETVVRR